MKKSANIQAKMDGASRRRDVLFPLSLCLPFVWSLGFEICSLPISFPLKLHPIPPLPVARLIRVQRRQRVGHLVDGCKPVRRRVCFIQRAQLDDFDRADAQPSHAQRVGAPARLHARAFPPPQRRPLRAGANLVPEALLEQELSHA